MSVFRFRQAADIPRLGRLAPRRPGLPTPNAGVCPEALAEAAAHCAESGVGTYTAPSGGPNRALVVRKQRLHEPTSEFGVTRQFDSVPACEARERANPKSAVGCANQLERELLRQLLPGRRLPGRRANAVESEQAELPAEPEIPVRCLSHAEDIASREPVPGGPRGVSVLLDTEGRIQSEPARTQRCKQADDKNAS